jgi:chromosome segregation ATPase
LDFYKQKYEDYSRLTVKVSELEGDIDKFKSKIDELNKNNEALQSKMSTYKEKLETEKTNNISLDIELTKKKTEIEGLKSEKRRLEATNNDLETKIHEINRTIEKQTREREDTERHYANTDKAMNELAGFQGMDVSEEAEAKAEAAAAHRDKSAIHEGEREILQQENDILKAKCKEIQIENENLKSGKNENTKAYDKLDSDNRTLKEELEQLRKKLANGVGTISDDAVNSLKVTF